MTFPDSCDDKFFIFLINSDVKGKCIGSPGAPENGEPHILFLINDRNVLCVPRHDGSVKLRDNPFSIGLSQGVTL